MTSSRFTTPPIPNWIKALRVPGYRNIYEYELGQQNLHGTETLFGDWSGELLLLAKDFAPSEYVENRIRAHDPMPYHHKPSLPTNKHLLELVAGYEGGILYASACFFLRGDGEWSGPLPNRRQALTESRPIFDFTIEHMPHFRAVACLGKDAWEFAVGRDSGWREHMEARVPLILDAGMFFAHAHPGHFGTMKRGKDNVGEDWTVMLDHLNSISPRADAA